MFSLVQLTVVVVEATQFHGVPVGTVPNVKPVGRVPATVIGFVSVGSPVEPLPPLSPSFLSDSVTFPVPPCVIGLVAPVVPVPVTGFSVKFRHHPLLTPPPGSRLV